jgi:hypothetical protein
MHQAVYILCAATSLLCAGLLAVSYRRRGTRLLLWSVLCFVGLAINNALLVVDLILIPESDLSLLRSGTGVAALLLFVIGLIWESR